VREALRDQYEAAGTECVLVLAGADAKLPSQDVEGLLGVRVDVQRRPGDTLRMRGFRNCQVTGGVFPGHLQHRVAPVTPGHVQALARAEHDRGPRLP
jgi:hypothetical protein